MSYSKRFWVGVREYRNRLIALFTTYIPVVFIAGYLGHYLTGAYTAAFWVGGAYMILLAITLVQIARVVSSPK